MIPAGELYAILVVSGLPGHAFHLPDADYQLCSAEWVRENWEAWLAARPRELCAFRDAAGKAILDRPLWLRDSSDCDNLALGTMVHGQVGNALSAQKTRLPRGGLAYGFLFYQAGPARPENFGVAGGHAINWWVDHARTVRFFEPGVGREVSLTPEERSSVWLALAS